MLYMQNCHLISGLLLEQSLLPVVEQLLKCLRRGLVHPSSKMECIATKRNNTYFTPVCEVDVPDTALIVVTELLLKPLFSNFGLIMLSLLEQERLPATTQLSVKFYNNIVLDNNILKLPYF
ncbi:hypothetical protein GQX74_010129 [Glossina fuscipes]|nr:hypothetical protein GQX74_010129 [Glossina fuscipes]